METKEIELTHDINLFYAEATDFPAGIPGAFKTLNEKVGDMANRHVYGITLCTGDKLIYRAGVNEDFNNEGAQYGLSSYTIPQGKYFAFALNNWAENLDQVPQLFDDLMKLPGVKKQTICVEDYTDTGDMIAMVQQA